MAGYGRLKPKLVAEFGAVVQSGTFGTRL